MNKPIKIKIDVTKLDKERFFRATSGAVYCDLIAWPLDEPGKYGDTHTIRQSKKKDETVKLPIVGNLTMPEDEPRQPAKQTPPRAPQGPTQAAPADTADDDSSVPF